MQFSEQFSFNWTQYFRNNRKSKRKMQRIKNSIIHNKSNQQQKEKKTKE